MIKMTRLKKIELLKQNGEKIEYHFYTAPSGPRRLIVDQIGEYSYNMLEQKNALELIDLMYWEWTTMIGMPEDR